MTGVAAEVGSTANNYQILARLATGGMAEIFLARGTSTTGVERYCVLKRILRDRASDVHFVRMFLDEARLAAQLQHPNVAQVYDIGKLGDSYFFTMEYVHGETVRALLHRARSLRREVPTGSILTVIAGAAAGLHHAHERLGHDGRPLGIVHRDVSPSNLMVSYEGGTKVVDFGVAKAENRAQDTRSGTVKGKIAYLSPEQCRGAPIDRRSDLFSLGIVFWEMLTTERLYKRPSDFDNMTAIVTEAPIAPSTRRPTIPPELDQISLRLLAKDPQARFQTADELVEALEEVAPKIGAMISSGGLGRFLREMFGQRPEPWLELDATQEVPSSSAEGVTVTSEPIPKELAVTVAPSMDMALSGVRDLSARLAEDAAPNPVPHAPSQMLTTPAMPAQVDTRRPLPLAAPPPSGITSPPAHAFPIVGSSSGAHAFPSGEHSGYPMISTQPPPGSTRSWSLIVIVAAAAIIGSLTVWFVMRGVGNETKQAGLEVTGPSDAGMEDDPPSDLAVAAVELDAQIESVDATVARVAVDAGVARGAIDGLPAGQAGVRTPPPPPRDERKIAMAEKRYGDVVALCAKGITGEHAQICTIAACQVSNETRARSWHNRISSGAARRSVTATCRDLGVDIVPKTVKQPPQPPPRTIDAGVIDPCAVNPMACQR